MEWIAGSKSAKKNAEIGDETAPAAGAAAAAAAVAAAAGAVAVAGNWYAKRKIRVAKYKLEGHNPAKILKLELHENQIAVKDPEAYKKAVGILRGEPHTKRYALDTISTPVEQVALLLDMAKDPNILGRTWVGWGPFI